MKQIIVYSSPAWICDADKVPDPINVLLDELKENTMNGYVCFYKGLRTEVHANTSYQAQGRAAAHFKVTEKNQHKITVVLAEKGGVQVVHTADT